VLELTMTGERALSGFLQIGLDQEGTGKILLGPDKVAYTLICEGGEVFVDRDRDGRVTDADGPGAGRGETFSLPFAYAGKTNEYSMLMYRPRPGGMLLMSRTRLEGKHGDQPVMVLDWNGNGIFGDDGDQIRFGSGGSLVPVTKVIACGLELVVPTFDSAAGKLHLDPYQGAKATLAVRTRRAGIGVNVNLQESNGRFYYSNTADGDALTCIPGEYIFRQIRLVKPNREEQQSSAMLYGSRTPTPATVEVKPGTNEVFVGPPFKLEFTAAPESGKGADALKIETVDLIGAAGEKYRAKTYRGSSSLDCLVRAGETEQKLASMDYG